MQRLSKLCALTLLQLQQRARQVIVFLPGVLQGADHAVEMPGELPCLQQGVARQTRIEAALGNLAKGCKQFVQHAERRPDSPPDRKQAQQ